jgi:hypothetical protein
MSDTKHDVYLYLMADAIEKSALRKVDFTTFTSWQEKYAWAWSAAAAALLSELFTEWLPHWMDR